MKNLDTRLESLEHKMVKPEPVHIIIKSYCGQSDVEAFDMYQAKRTAEGYAPKEGWQKLKEKFLAPDPGNGKQIDFIKYEIVGSTAPVPPKVTNAIIGVKDAS